MKWSHLRLFSAIGVFFTGVMVLISAFSQEAVAQDQPGSPELREFVGKEPELSAVTAVAMATQKALEPECVDPVITPTNLVVVLEPVEFQAGGPQKGAWTQRFNATACGKQKVLNVLSFAKNGVISRVELLPGMTIAGPILQFDAYKQTVPVGVMTYLTFKKKDPKDCLQSRVIDTEFMGFTGTSANASQPAPGRPWREVWTVQTKCNDVFKLPIDFKPDSRGTGFTVNSDDLKKLNGL